MPPEIIIQLRAFGVNSFPCKVWYDAERGKWSKKPIVPHWKENALLDPSDRLFDWSTGSFGVCVPDGVVIIDLDLYQGVTRQSVEYALGCELDWPRALIQKTVGGGEHYAFYCDDADSIVQDSGLLGVTGFDTRVGGRGYICTGQGYNLCGVAGLFALGLPDTLPRLPPAAVSKLSKQMPAAATDLAQPVTSDTSEVIDALRHIDPGCGRTQWRNVGYALKKLFEHDDSAGQYIYEQWSSGELWPDGAPVNYVPEGPGSVADQWPTYKADGGVHPATLYHYAIESGWKPPARFDAQAVFGANPIAEDAFNSLVDTIREQACDVRRVAGIIDEIRSSGCSDLQIALLASELKNELQLNGIKDRAVSRHVDKLLTACAPPALAPPENLEKYGKSDTDNATIFLSRHYPNNSLVRCDKDFYRFNGKCWEVITADRIKHQIANDMTSSRAQESKIAACYRMVTMLSPVYDGSLNKTDSRYVLFQNGILDVPTGALMPHSPDFFSTNIMPYAWDAIAQCPQWLAFLSDSFSGDAERIALLQEWIGYLMTKDYSHHKIMLLIGGPRCGKGTVGRIIGKLVGPENFSGGSLSSLATDSFIDGLRTKPVLFVGDAQKRISSRVVSEVIEKMKSISGHDSIAWHKMYFGAVSEALPSRITIAANNIPALFDDSGALANRMIPLPFDKCYLGNEDLTLGARLETELPGIAVWALNGWQRLVAQGRFTMPAASEVELDFIRDSYGPIARFVQDCCVIGPEYKVGSQDIYESYRAWAVATGEDLLRPKTLTSSLRDALRGRGPIYGNHRIDGRVIRGFYGIGLAHPIEASGPGAMFQLVGGTG